MEVYQRWPRIGSIRETMPSPPLVACQAVGPGAPLNNTDALPLAWKQAWLQQSWVTQFDLLRPFLLGIVLLLALVIHGRIVKHKDT